MRFNFDANTVKPADIFDPIPEGWVHAQIENHEAKAVKDKPNCGYVQLQLTVIDGEHAGRKFRDNLNLWSDSTQAVEIAQRQLSSYCHATGVLVLNDFSQLHGIPINVRLGIRKQEGFEPSNVVRAVKHIQDSVGQPAAPALPSMPAMPPAAPALPAGAPIEPWGRNPSLPAQPTPQQPPMPSQQPAPMSTSTPPWEQQQAPVQQPAAPAMPSAAPPVWQLPVAPAAPTQQKMPWQK